MRYLILSVLILVATFTDSFSQSSTATQDVRQVVGITKLTSSSNEAAERFLPLVTERLVDVVEGTNRFRLVDMTSEEARREALDELKTITKLIMPLMLRITLHSLRNIP